MPINMIVCERKLRPISNFTVVVLAGWVHAHGKGGQDRSLTEAPQA